MRLVGMSPERRPLTEEDRILLEWLLLSGSSDTKSYRSQIANVNVVGGCTSGCPSIDLAPGDRELRKTGPSMILAEFVGKTPEGIEVGLILHARERETSELKVYSMPDVNGPFSLLEGPRK